MKPFMSADGAWRVDVIELSETSSRRGEALRGAAAHDGVYYRVTHYGYHAADCKTQAEVESLTSIPFGELLCA